MKRLAVVAIIGVLFFFSLNTSLAGDIGHLFEEENNLIQSQEPMGIDFVSPMGGDNLSGFITIKINVTMIQGAEVRLRWNDDTWIDLTNYYNSTSNLYEYPMDVTCLQTGPVTFIAQQLTTHGNIQATLDAYIDWERPP
ncbi:MAG: hypothetical protein RTU30_12965, partial [Candidatus Thorarchaeota archaeon]